MFVNVSMYVSVNVSLVVTVVNFTVQERVGTRSEAAILPLSRRSAGQAGHRGKDAPSADAAPRRAAPRTTIPFPAGHECGGGRFRCRCPAAPLPQGRHGPAAVWVSAAPDGCGHWCPQAVSAVRTTGLPLSVTAPTWSG